MACGNACTRHDRGRRGQSQRAWAGDDQNGHGVDHSGFERGTGQPPPHQGDRGEYQYGGHEHLAYPVDQFLNGRLGGLGVFNQADDTRQDGFCAKRLGADQ